MTVLIDWPRWPAPCTVWGHLLCDESPAELHPFPASAAPPTDRYDPRPSDSLVHLRHHAIPAGNG